MSDQPAETPPSPDDDASPSKLLNWISKIATPMIHRIFAKQGVSEEDVQALFNGAADRLIDARALVHGGELTTGEQVKGIVAQEQAISGLYVSIQQATAAVEDTGRRFALLQQKLGEHLDKLHEEIQNGHQNVQQSTTNGKGRDTRTPRGVDSPQPPQPGKEASKRATRQDKAGAGPAGPKAGQEGRQEGGKEGGEKGPQASREEAEEK